LEEDNTPKAYYLSSQLDFAPQLSVSNMAMGGVPQYATYLAHRFYDSDMTRKNLLSLAISLISETATQDPKVGGPIRIAEISPENGFVEIEPSLVKDIRQKNEEFIQEMKNYFFRRE
jgi:20S proteasome alpha/beta subunit